MNVPDGLLFTKDHEWVIIEANRATVGISDYAQSSLGDITFVEMPGIGKNFKQSEMIATVESVKAASEVYAPMAGKIVEVNDDIVRTPELINKSPYEKGWFCVIELSDKEEKKKLMTPEKYREFIKGLH